MSPVAVSSSVIDWLLSEQNPPVRYLTLTRLLDKGERSRQVREAKALLGEYGPTRKILERRASIWKDGANLYQKYGGGFWQLIFLGEFLAPRDLPGVEQGVEFVLGKRGTYASRGDWWSIHCLNANLLRAMVALGFGRDQRVLDGLEHIAEEVVAAKGVPCRVIDWSLLDHCSMALPKVLLALTSLPVDKRSPAMKRAARICRDRLLEQEVSRYVPRFSKDWHEHVKKSPDIPNSMSPKPEKRAQVFAAKRAFIAERGGLGERGEKAGWRKFGFPLHYNSDILEALGALAQADAPGRSPRLRGPIEHVLVRRRDDGRWALEQSLNGKMLADVERKGAPSRWITFRALAVLRAFRGIEIKS